MMCLLHRIGDGDRLLEVTGVQLSPSSGSTGSLLLALLPSSFSKSFSDSAELDSSVSSLFPNKPLSGFGERSLLLSLGSSGKESIFFLRSFLLSCLRAYEGLLLFPCEGPDFSLFSENTKEFLILTDIENCNPFPASREHNSTTCFKGVSLSHPLSLMESMESSIMTGQLLCRPGACVSSAAQQQLCSNSSFQYIGRQSRPSEKLDLYLSGYFPIFSFF